MAEIIDKRFPRIVTTDSQNNMDLSGGGGGDFTTCKMTVINQTGAQVMITVPCIMGNPENPEETLASPVAIIGNDSTEVSVILYKSKAVCLMGIIGQTYTHTFSGDYDDDNGICYGDCTITLLSGGNN